MLAQRKTKHTGLLKLILFISDDDLFIFALPQRIVLFNARPSLYRYNKHPVAHVRKKTARSMEKHRKTSRSLQHVFSHYHFVVVDFSSCRLIFVGVFHFVSLSKGRLENLREPPPLGTPP